MLEIWFMIKGGHFFVLYIDRSIMVEVPYIASKTSQLIAKRSKSTISTKGIHPGPDNQLGLNINQYLG